MQTPEVEVEQDEALAALLGDLIVGEIPQVSLISSTSTAADCGSESSGCYLPAKNAIVVSADLSAFQRPELLAHEYLHYVWERDGLGDDKELADAIAKDAADKEGLAALVPSWQQDYIRADGSVEPTELFSYSCTGMRPEQQSLPVATACADYLNIDELPVNQSLTVQDLTAEIARQRQEAGVPALQDNPYAAAASEARAELFTPSSQVPLDEYPESVTKHLDEGCAPASYAARLVRPYDASELVRDTDALLKGALLAGSTKGLGIAVKEFAYIDATKLFGDRTLRVNATLIVTTVCT
ncbi:hypothetical protein BW730_05570 [Tessaracoccus aquimaris]|uniref:Uncharacterized protein n=1 Tax=Tessaracoccus aquimaris TaxID=1332264 RepID=A0A1Q2CLR9_9ACTN|nr:hypothetical protein [Tessaracoccus aquimaris]AQP47064.1 hypothetical protein BW730_05570 [Tessaracoccus aquimaris]